MLLNESPRQRRLSAQGLHAAHDQQQGRPQGADQEHQHPRRQGDQRRLRQVDVRGVPVLQGPRAVPGAARAPSATPTRSTGGRYNSRPAQLVRPQLHDLHRQRLAAELGEQRLRRRCCAPPAAMSRRSRYPTSVVKSTDQANWMDEYARFMRGVDVSTRDGSQGIVTHTRGGRRRVERRPLSELHGSRSPSRAAARITAPATPTPCVKGLHEIFNEIQAVNSVFASASLPVSVNARGTYLNQVYMGMFRPDGDGKPRWRGNLKQYQFGLDAARQAVAGRFERRTAAVSSSTGLHQPERGVVLDHAEHLLEQPAAGHAALEQRLARRRDRREGRRGAAPAQPASRRRRRRATCSPASAARRGRRSAAPSRRASRAPTR